MEFKGSKIEFDLEELAPLLIADKQEGLYCPHLSRPNPNYHLLKCFFFYGDIIELRDKRIYTAYLHFCPRNF
jgi:hypothetical protein